MWLIFLELFIIIIIFKQFYAVKHCVHFNNISIDKKKFFNFDNGNKSSKSITISLLYLFYIISHWWKIGENFTYPVQDIHFLDPFKKGNSGMG